MTKSRYAGKVKPPTVHPAGEQLGRRGSIGCGPPSPT